VNEVNTEETGSVPPGRPALKDRVKEELIRYFEVAAYLFVVLAALLFYRNALLREAGVSGLSLGLAAGKALILGKFLLLGESAGIGRRFRAPTLWVAMLRQAVFMWVLLIVLSVAEEFIVGLVHGHSLTETMAGYEAHSVELLISKSVVLLLVLLPLIATAELSKALGPGVLGRLLMQEERTTNGG
jgi:hypothetical protein